MEGKRGSESENDGAVGTGAKGKVQRADQDLVGRGRVDCFYGELEEVGGRACELGGDVGCEESA